MSRVLIFILLILIWPFQVFAQETGDMAEQPETTDVIYPDTLPHPSQDDKLLGLRLWVIETIPVDREIIQVTMESHIRYQLKLEREGIMFAAGPIYGAEAERPDGNGLIVIRAESAEEARAIADNDPMHASGGRRYILRQWRVNEGSFTVTIPFSRYHVPEIK